MKVIFSAVRPS